MRRYRRPNRNSAAWSRRPLKVLLTLGVALSLLCMTLVLEAQQSRTAEYRAKAYFLANLPIFVEWPAEAIPPGQAPLLFCILGDFSLGAPLADAIRGKTVHERTVEIRGVRKEQELRSCSVLFVSQFEQKGYQHILDTVRGQSVLTVGETPEFLDAGGMVSLSGQEGTIRFDVNLQAVNSAHLKISSRLLALARRIVNPTEAAKS